MAIQRIQTDHGSEFGTDFTWHLQDAAFCTGGSHEVGPESNGKVERSHRTDADEFYRRAQFKSTEELAKQLARWEHETTTGASTWRSAVARRPSASASSASPRRLLVDAQLDAARENRGPLCRRIESSAANHTVAPPESGRSYRKSSSPDRAAPGVQQTADHHNHMEGGAEVLVHRFRVISRDRQGASVQ
jgi:hypothetical protein